jgi:FtsP/CotA-like multicopper oxidase with cupredoxin domain
MDRNRQEFMLRLVVTAASVLVLLLASYWVLEGRERSGGVTRRYYIAADEVLWDYAPAGNNVGAGGRTFTEEEAPFTEVGPHRIGRVVRKAIYRAYTDSTFTTPVVRTEEWQHLGILGPLIRAEVGDTIRIVFRNNAPFPASVHPHGVFYDKDSEGAPYGDGTTGGDVADDGVAPGGTHVYVWPVPERAGPTEHEGTTAFWMYHSHTDEIRDIASGLIGPLIITRKGEARADGSPKDVDRELVVGLLEFDENQSWYIEDNVRERALKPDEVIFARSPFGDRATRPDFGSYFRETINGYLYGNAPGLDMRVGERVRWYLMASTNFEFHAPHWHGNVVVSDMMRTDVGQLLPMGMQVADMVPDNAGTWLFHCHVSSHLRMGMTSLYRVLPGPVASDARPH